MKKLVAYCILGSILISSISPSVALAETETTVQTAEEVGDGNEISAQTAAVAAMSSGWPEPEERSYGIESISPELADPNDPTLSSLSDQSLVNLFQGAAEFNLPLSLPPGLNGMTPKLELKYSSHQASTNGKVGQGWQLETGAIRKVARGTSTVLLGPPRYYLELPDIQGDLTQFGSSANYDYYHLRREQEFANIEHDRLNNYWTVDLRDGRSFHLGSTPDSRTQTDDGTFVSAWHVDEQNDPYGNQIEYDYQRIDGVLYPERISYGASSGSGPHPFDVAFSIAPRVDSRLDYQAGFSRTLGHLVDQITIDVNGTERLRYDLSYDNGFMNSRSDLQQFTVTGTNGTEITSQQIAFEYYRVTDSDIGPRADRLKRVTLPTGGQLTYDYQVSQQLQSEGEFVNQRPHFPIIVVTSLTESDFLGREDETEYFYRDGHYYYDSALNRQVAGFSRVTVTDPLQQQQRHFFHQGGGFDGSTVGESPDSWYLIGKSYRQEQFDDQENLIERTITRWQSTPLGSERSFIAPIDHIVTRIGILGPDQSHATTTSYDLSNGNVLETLEHGAVNANNDGTFTDIDSDSRRRTFTYAANPYRYLPSLSATEKLYNHGNTLMSQTDRRYDGLPLGLANRGSLTHEGQHLLSEARQLVTQREYNLAGQLKATIDPKGHRQDIDYDAIGIHPAWIQNHLGHRTDYVVDPVTGKRERETTPSNLVTERVFDGLGREILRSQSHPLHSNSLWPVEKVTFDDSSRPSSVLTETYLSPTLTSKQAAYLDGFGRTVQRRRQASGAPDRYAVTNTQFDALGRESHEELSIFGTGVDYDTADTSPYGTTTAYDALGRVVLVTDANGTSTSSFDGWSRTDQDANGVDKTLTFDAFDRLAQVTEDIDGFLVDSEYTYDALDNVIAITDATGNERAFQYDSLSRLRSAEDIHSPGDTTVSTKQWSYDDADNVRLVADSAGRHASTSHDELDRPVEHVFTGAVVGSETINLTYDQGAFGIGQLSDVTSTDWNWQGTYDIRGQLVSETATVKGSPHSRQHTFTYFDQIDQTTHGNGIVVDHGYNEIGELQSIDVGSTNVVSDIAYNAASQVAEIDYGNGLRSEMTHAPEKMHRLTAKRTYRISSPYQRVQDITYSFDPVGNIERIRELANTAGVRLVDYDYDTVNRLERATATFTSSANYDFSYVYDAAGNIITSPEGSYLYEEPLHTNPQAVTSITNGANSIEFEYDPTGNLLVQRATAGGVTETQQHSWNNRSLLEETVLFASNTIDRTELHYGYDDEQRRTWKEVQPYSCSTDSSHGLTCTPGMAEETLYPFADYELSNTDTSRIHVYANGIHVATAETDFCSAGSNQSSCTTDLYFHHDDHLNGANVITDASGQITQLLDYQPFGAINTEQQVGTYDATQDFTGHELDSESGLHYAQARYYDSDTARFISHDPLAWRPSELLDRFGEQPQGLNFYSYALNNPIVLADPTGEFACGGLCLVMLGVGGAYLTTGAETAVAPSTIENQAASMTSNVQSPSLFEGFMNNAASAAEERGIRGAAGAIRAGSVIGGGVAAARSGYGATKAIGALGTAVEIADTMNRIERGQRHTHVNDGSTFRNDGRGEKLPEKPRGYYTEYVQSGKNLDDYKHPNRMVYGRMGERYTTRDHYKTFRPVNRLTDLLRRFRR